MQSHPFCATQCHPDMVFPSRGLSLQRALRLPLLPLIRGPALADRIGSVLGGGSRACHSKPKQIGAFLTTWY
uniref:Alternative protein CHST15 n=1 Tax=Homo sapiens TaxID=9606 RepID=L8EAU1_HUMAN|nr:alternative protein CHST15 [Homo sapiens]